MATMKAIRMHEYGPPSVLRFEDAPRPEPGSNEALVRVSAAGVNPVDWKLRAGFMKNLLPLPLPWIPGVDFSGAIESINARGTFAAGEEVFGKADLPNNGTYADFVVVPVANLVQKPRRLDHVQAAALPLVALTAWQTLFAGGLELAAGQSLLILGAAGGVGTIAVQLAKWKGARVIAAARAKHEAYVKKVGADGFVDTTKGLASAGQVDAILDLVGGDLAQHAWAQLKKGGAFTSVMGPPSAEAAKARDARTAMIVTHNDAQQLCEIAGLVEKGLLQPLETTTLPLAQARTAHERLEGHGVVGKIVLTVR